MTSTEGDDEQDRPRVRNRTRRNLPALTGREISARNATRHGALSRDIVGSREEQAAFIELLADLESEFDPATATERSLVERLATLFWRERRLARAEAETLREHERDHGALDPAVPFDIHYQGLVGRYQTMLGNQVSKTIDQLRRLKKERDGSLE